MFLSTICSGFKEGSPSILHFFVAATFLESYLITFSFLLQSESANLCLASRRGLISKAMEETKSSAANGGQSTSAAAATTTAATQQTTNNTGSPAPSPISPTPNSPKPISPTPNSPKPLSPTPSLLFRSREASSDGSISPCKFTSSSDYVLM